MYGCETDTGSWKIREWEFKRCPIKLITEDTKECIKAYNLLQLGKWPYDKGWLQHGNKFIEAITVMDMESKRLENETRKEAMKK